VTVAFLYHVQIFLLTYSLKTVSMMLVAIHCRTVLANSLPLSLVQVVGKVGEFLLCGEVWHSATSVITQYADGSGGGRVYTGVCLSVLAWNLKNQCNWDHQAWRTNVPRWVLKTRLFLGQKVKGRESQKQCWRGLLHSYEILLLIYYSVLVTKLPVCQRVTMTAFLCRQWIWLNWGDRWLKCQAYRL